MNENNNSYKKIIEGLLFASPRPLSPEKIAEIIEISEKDINGMLEEMKQEFEERGINIREVPEGFEMCTNPILYDYIEKLDNLTTRTSLSKASLETLAIIAYNQPITRAEIEELRGTRSSNILSTLIAAKLIRMAGKKQVIGRPYMYATTKYFLKHFGITSLEDLPKIEGFS